MQDQTKNNPDQKQYFDIKGATNPDPTSRPVVNNNPIQEDPMVSVATQPQTPPIPTQTAPVDLQPSESISTPPAAVSEHLANSTPEQPQPLPTTDNQPTSQHTVSVHKESPVKKIIGVAIMIFLIVVAALIYKYKLGK